MELIGAEVTEEVVTEIPKKEMSEPWYLTPVKLEDGTIDYPELRRLQKERSLLVYQREF